MHEEEEEYDYYTGTKKRKYKSILKEEEELPYKSDIGELEYILEIAGLESDEITNHFWKKYIVYIEKYG